MAIAGEKTGPVSGQPPSLSTEATEALVSSSQKDPQGHNAPGRDGGDAEAPKKQKTEKERTQSCQENNQNDQRSDTKQSQRNEPRPTRHASLLRSKPSKPLLLLLQARSRRRSPRRRRRLCPSTSKRRPRERRRVRAENRESNKQKPCIDKAQSSSLWTTSTTRPTFPRSSSQHGMTGGRRRVSTSPSLDLMETSSPAVTSLSLSPHRTSLVLCIAATPSPHLSRTL